MIWQHKAMKIQNKPMLSVFARGTIFVWCSFTLFPETSGSHSHDYTIFWTVYANLVLKLYGKFTAL